MCPTCNSEAGFTYDAHEWTEPHGEHCRQEYCRCKACGAETDEQELDGLEEKANAAVA